MRENTESRAVQKLDSPKTGQLKMARNSARPPRDNDYGGLLS